MKRGRLLFTSVGVVLCALFLGGAAVHADGTTSGFNLQVTPSPLIATVEPGTKTTEIIKIHNGGSTTEQLKVEVRSFDFDSASGKVNLQDTITPPIAAWVDFSAPKFTVQAGQWFNEQVTFNMPKDTGFSYSFVLLISRQANPKPGNGSQGINGSLAIFSLINVDRPGATSKLTVTQFSTTKRMYDYLPASFSIRFRNSGNTIVQPLGNVFVQRSSSGSTPLATLNVNPNKGYILPGTERTTTTDWSDGFPAYQTTTDPNGTTHRKLVWNWAKLSQLRIGHYTAHLVAVYSQAGRDVPLQGTVGFWVIPWKILLLLLGIVLLVVFGIFMIVWSIVKFVRRRHAKRVEKKASKQHGHNTPEV